MPQTKFSPLSIVHLAAVGLFLCIAWVQLNDPDPWYWIAVYGLTAAVPIGKLLNRPNQAIVWIATGMICSGLLISAPGFAQYLSSGDYAAISGEMMGSKPYIESAREFGGLLIAGCILAAYQYKLRA